MDQNQSRIALLVSSIVAAVSGLFLPILSIMGEDGNFFDIMEGFGEEGSPVFFLLMVIAMIACAGVAIYCAVVSNKKLSFLVSAIGVVCAIVGIFALSSWIDELAGPFGKAVLGDVTDLLGFGYWLTAIALAANAVISKIAKD